MRLGSYSRLRRTATRCSRRAELGVVALVSEVLHHERARPERDSRGLRFRRRPARIERGRKSAATNCHGDPPSMAARQAEGSLDPFRVRFSVVPAAPRRRHFSYPEALT